MFVLPEISHKKDNNNDSLTPNTTTGSELRQTIDRFKSPQGEGSAMAKVSYSYGPCTIYSDQGTE